MQLRRRVVDDEITIDDETVVLADGQATLLSRPASFALGLLSTDEWVSADHIFARMATEFGIPPEGSEAMRELVSGLVELGVVETDAGV